ncbi:MAG: DUF3226 domain-containing protein [Blastocatellia bacterium]
MTADPFNDIPQPANPLSPSKPQPLKHQKLLVGEGDEEVYFFGALLKHLNIADVQIEQCKGKTKLHNYILTLTKRSDFANLVAIAITRDADDDAMAAFQSVVTALDNAGLAKPQTSGSFIDGKPKIGVFILPDCQERGMLEDLCLASAATDIAMPCVDEFFRCVENNGRKPNNMAKARAHAWLASHVEPDKRLGEAAQKGYWDWDSPVFDPLKHFLHQL